jgi:hypothetical protein
MYSLSEVVTLRFFSLTLSCSFLLLACSLSASADPYLIDPTGGTALTFTAGDNDNGVTANQALGFNFTLFPGGANATTSTNLAASVNGFLVMRVTGVPTTGIVDSSRGFPIPSEQMRIIGAFWDDLVIPAGSTGSVTKQSTANYTAVTWNVYRQGQSGITAPTTNFQAAVFGAGTTVRGFNFLANDIAFTYNSLPTTPEGGSAAIGLNSGFTGVGAAPAAALIGNDAQGRVTGTTAIPLHNTADQFLLLRPDNVGGYTISIQTLAAAIPEPSTLALLGLGMAGLLVRSRRFTTQK